MSITTAIEAQTALLASELPLLRSMLSAGTVFPAVPTVNMRFFRTDLSIDCYYDGEKWLTVQEYMLCASALGVQSVAHSLIASIDYVTSVYVTRTVFTYLVTGTPHNGSNYWTCQLHIGVRGDTGYPTGSLLTSAQNQTYLVNLYDSIGQTINAIKTNTAMLVGAIAKVGSPGSAYTSFIVYYRKIIS